MKMNLKIKGVVALLAAGLVLGGCASTLDTQKTESKIKAGNGIAFGMIPPFGSKRPVESVCEKFAAANDERCVRQSEFNAYTLVITNPHLSPVSTPDIVDVLVPKSIRGLKGEDIIKVRLDGLRPAYFELIAAEKGEKDCYYGISGSTWAGVICPKYSWDYRKDLKL